MARPKTSHPTDREFAILRVLWESGPSTVREVYQTLDKQQKTAYTSVLSVMQTMTGRGLLERDESERGHVYSTTRSQEETQQHSVRDLVDHVFNGSTMSLVFLMLTMLTLSMAALSQPPAHAQESETSLDARELQNVKAFVQLLGYVRYFHPSDAVGATDWDAFTVLHIESVEDAANPEELAERLTRLFAPLAPTLRVFSTGESTELPETLLRPREVEPLFITMWVHASIAGQLRSERLSARVTQGELLETLPYQGWSEFGFVLENVNLTVPNPAELYYVELSGGVTALIPLVLYADERGTLPHEGAAAEVETLSGSQEVRPVRLAAVAVLWNAMQHFFPYWDAVEVDWLSALGEALSAAAVAETRQDMSRVLERLMAHLEDGHVQVSPVVTDIGISAPFTLELVEGELVVTTVFSELAEGLSVGDTFLSINGESALEVFAEEEKYVSGAGQWRRFRTLRRVLSQAAARGDITVEVRPAGGGDVLTTKAEPIPVSPDVRDELREPRPPVVAQLAPGILYVDVTRVQEDRFQLLLPILEDASGLVFDTRGSTNSFLHELLHHLTDRPLEAPPGFIPIVTRPDQSDVLTVDATPVLARPKAPRLTDNVAFIINSAAISSPEFSTGLVERHGIAELVGEPTAGATGNVATITLPGGYNGIWTGMRVTKADGSPHFRVGVTPTIPVTRTHEGIAAGRDELLEAAFKTVSGLPASEMEISLLEP